MYIVYCGVNGPFDWLVILMQQDLFFVSTVEHVHHTKGYTAQLMLITYRCRPHVYSKQNWTCFNLFGLIVD